MTRAGSLFPVLLLAIGVVGQAFAVPPGLSIEFDGNGEGKVTFTGTVHTGPGMHCSNCHLEIFDVSRSSQITRPDHKRRNACFVCHDGKQAFAAKQNCIRCHAEPAAPAADTVAVAGTAAGAATP